MNGQNVCLSLTHNHPRSATVDQPRVHNVYNVDLSFVGLYLFLIQISEAYTLNDRPLD